MPHTLLTHLNANVTSGVASCSALTLRVGQRARFAGFRTTSWEYPAIKIGEECVIVSVKQPGQSGFDYWAKMDSGGRFAFQEGELEKIPNAATISTEKHETGDGGASIPQPTPKSE